MSESEESDGGLNTLSSRLYSFGIGGAVAWDEGWATGGRTALFEATCCEEEDAGGCRAAGVRRRDTGGGLLLIVDAVSCSGVTTRVAAGGAAGEAEVDGVLCFEWAVDESVLFDVVVVNVVVVVCSSFSFPSVSKSSIWVKYESRWVNLGLPEELVVLMMVDDRAMDGLSIGIGNASRTSRS